LAFPFDRGVLVGNNLRRPVRILSPWPSSMEPPRADFQRYPDLWFQDGTFVLLASGTGFRRNHELLAKRSPIFKDLFSKPQPSGSETIEGCPILHLSDDSPEDITEFLNIVYFGMWHQTTGGYPTWATVRAMFIIGTKCQIEDLRTNTLKNLETAFPKDIASYDTIVFPNISPYMKLEDKDYIGVANLAREYGDNIPSHIRWQALYYCTQLPNPTLISGISDSTSTSKP